MKIFMGLVVCIMLGYMSYVSLTLTSISAQLQETNNKLGSIQKSFTELNSNTKKVSETLVDIFSLKPDTEDDDDRKR